MIFKGVSMVFFNFRSRLWSLFVVFQSTWSFYCLTSMFNFNAICRGRTLCGGHCLPSEVDFDRYLSWPDMVCFFMFFFRSRLWSLFVVFQSNWVLYCLPSMLDFDVISCGWTSSASLCFPSEVDFECYLSWPDMVCFFMFFFRSRLWSLFVVFQSNWVCYCLSSLHFTPVLCFSLMLDFDAICRVWSYFWRYNLYFLIFFLWF